MDDMDDYTRKLRQENYRKLMCRMDVTRLLTRNQYNRLMQYEKKHGEQTPDQIAKIFKIVGGVE